jgi:hypothetical protein
MFEFKYKGESSGWELVNEILTLAGEDSCEFRTHYMIVDTYSKTNGLLMHSLTHESHIKSVQRAIDNGDVVVGSEIYPLNEQ